MMYETSEIYSKYHEEYVPAIDISGKVIRETLEAYLFGDEEEEEWYPKSQVELDSSRTLLTCPEWLAAEKGII